MEPSQFVDPDADPKERIKPRDYFPLILFAVGFCMVMGMVVWEEVTGPHFKAGKHRMPTQVETVE